MMDMFAYNISFDLQNYLLGKLKKINRWVVQLSSKKDLSQFEHPLLMFACVHFLYF